MGDAAAGGGGRGALGSGVELFTRSTFHARMLLNQRSCHWRASISKDTVNSSPILILNCSIFSAPKTSKHILRGYWLWSSTTYSCTFHSLTDDLATSPLGWSMAITFPD